jgi:hypothetical protein
MDESLGLVLDCRYNLRRGVARVETAQAAGEVQKTIAVDIFNDSPVSIVYEDGQYGAE